MCAGTSLHCERTVRLNSVSEGLVLFISSEIDGLITQGSRPGRSFCESVGGVFEMISSDWLNGTYSIPDPTLCLSRHWSECMKTLLSGGHAPTDRGAKDEI